MSKNKFLVPLVLVTALFFLWGFAYGLLDVLNKHFQETLNITKARSTLLQAAYFGAYFFVALPAGFFIKRFGYKKGIILGLVLFACGAFLFYPAALQKSFQFFLGALFILAAGLTCLETAANPYITILGQPETSATRLNLSQCFNGLGSLVGPLIGAFFFFGTDGTAASTHVQIVYVGTGALGLLIAVFFLFTKLPEISNGESQHGNITKSLFAHTNFRNGVISQFFYVAAQVGVAALFINYCTESVVALSSKAASNLLSISLLLFTIGRFTGTALMRRVAANRLVMVYALINVLLCVVVVFDVSTFSLYALMAIFFFMSIMFPTIFALSIKGLGNNTKKGSSIIIMSIVGGALMPFVMGLVADAWSTATAYIVPLFCFIVVAWYGWKGYKTRTLLTESAVSPIQNEFYVSA